MQTPSFSTTGASRVWSCDVDMTGNEAATSPPMGATDGSDSSPPPRKFTYLVRKEEKEKLQREVEELQAKLRGMEEAEREQAFALADQRQRMLQQELETSLMRDGVRAQQLSLVNVQSAVSGYVSSQGSTPHEVPICLGSDFNQRRDVLAGLKRRKIQAALAYISGRVRFLDPFQPFAESTQFRLSNGDYCSVCTEMAQFDAARVSVRRVYDAVLDFFANMEMRVTDILGDVTTSDEADYGLDGIHQSRSVSTIADGIHLEINSVSIYEFSERSDEYADGGPLGVVTANFVDRDDLHPYRPSDCLREDVNVVITVRSCSRKRYNPVTKKEQEETAVVLARSCFVKLRRPEITLPPLVERRLRKKLGEWGDFLVSSVLEQIYAD